MDSHDEIVILSRQPNAVVVQLPERSFPGLLIQGDSLKNLQSLAASLRSLISDSSEVADLAEELEDLLSGYVAAYEQTLEASGIALPYPTRKP